MVHWYHYSILDDTHSHAAGIRSKLEKLNEEHFNFSSVTVGFKLEEKVNIREPVAE